MVMGQCVWMMLFVMVLGTVQGFSIPTPRMIRKRIHRTIAGNTCSNKVVQSPKLFMATDDNPQDDATSDDDDDEDDWPEEIHEEYWLDTEAEQDTSISLGEAIAQGQVVLCVPDVATSDDCLALFSAGLQACERRSTPAARGRSRFSVSDPQAFPNDIVLRCDEMLLRVLDYVDDVIPSIYETLFEPNDEWLQYQPLNAQLEQPTVPPLEYLAETCTGIRDLYMTSELEWSEGEPAINIYEQNGYFGAHKDHLAMTILIPLTQPTQDFAGGGTGFWKGNREVDENPSTPPDLVIKPPAGSALIFGGDVTHAGMPVKQGYRSVFVCSMSTKTPASAPDRLHGMQAPPQVSPNFKGTM
mmetsp:Transcript_40867/g.85071  ORF Transcript_40867/g.85071 Transcript_40867/m.85071 type:complete len:356 (-) Transcript_40867:106-1173(-)